MAPFGLKICLIALSPQHIHKPPRILLRRLDLITSLVALCCLSGRNDYARSFFRLMTAAHGFGDVKPRALLDRTPTDFRKYHGSHGYLFEMAIKIIIINGVYILFYLELNHLLRLSSR